jgi:hypothetical protein
VAEIRAGLATDAACPFRHGFFPLGHGRHAKEPPVAAAAQQVLPHFNVTRKRIRKKPEFDRVIN